MAAPNVVCKQLANSDATTDTATGLTAGANGTQIKEIQVTTGPTTAPGTGVLTLNLRIGGTSYPWKQVTLVNTVNTEVTTIYVPNLTLPSGATIYVQMRTAITSGGTVAITIIGTDL